MIWRYLYCPWRQKYTSNVQQKKNKQIKECVFCEQIADDQDEKHFFLHRYNHHVVMLNLYPYNAGHLLVVPYNHCNSLNAVSDEILVEKIKLIQASVKILTDVMKAHGCNVGINIGPASGAGIPEHLHVHVLPRWMNDINFLSALTDTRHISIDLVRLYQDLRPHFQNVAAKIT